MAEGKSPSKFPAKFCPITFADGEHKLYVVLETKEFFRINNCADEKSCTVAISLGYRHRNSGCNATGSRRLYVTICAWSRQQEILEESPIRSEAEDSVKLYCTNTFLQHYNIKPEVPVFVHKITPHPLKSMVLHCKTEAAFHWAKEQFLSTGILVSVCKQNILIRNNDILLIPSHSFSEHEIFSMDLLFDIIVQNCCPLNQGILSLATEIIISNQSGNKCSDNKNNGVVDDTVDHSLLVSEFVTCNLNYRKGVTGNIDFNRMSSVIHSNDYSVHCLLMKNAEFCDTLGDTSSVDIHSTVLLSEAAMEKLGLFDGSLVLVSAEPKCSDDRQEMDETAVLNRSQHVAYALVWKSYTDGEDEAACLLASLWFNCGGTSLQSQQMLNIQKWYPDCRSEVIQSASSQQVLPWAQEVRVSVVHSPDYLPTVDIDAQLQKYFSKTRYLNEGDVLCLEPENDPESFEKHEDLMDCHYATVYVKVVAVQGPKDRSNNAYAVDVRHTTLYQGSPVHSYVPSDNRSRPCMSPTAGVSSYIHTITHYSLPHLKQHGNVGGNVASILLTGPAACGKTLVATEVASTLHMHHVKVDCSELCGDTSAATEARIKALLHRAVGFAPCILMLKNIHLLAKDKEAHGEDVRVAASFLAQLKEMQATTGNWPVVVIATTSQLQLVNPNLQEAFLHHVIMEVPDEANRAVMLRELLQGMDCEADVSISHIAQRTAGLVLGDLCALINHVKKSAIERISQVCFPGRSRVSLREEEELVWAGYSLSRQDFDTALDQLQAAHSEAIGAPKIPRVLWADVGGLAAIKADILDTIQLPLEHPELLAAGLRRSGVLLYGPPGTGKTLLAKAVATQCSLNFLSVKGPELINMYVGQSEENVREVFSCARDASPCVIFFDELDSLAPNRGRSGDSGGVMDRVVSQLLAELDGLHRACDVFVIGATNRPDLLDPALLRPGRFDKLLYVGVSETKDAQLNVLQALTRKLNVSADCDLRQVVKQCPMNLTGADFYALSSDATLNAIKRRVALLEAGMGSQQGEIVVEWQDFQAALKDLIPSVSAEELARYRAVQAAYSNRK